MKTSISAATLASFPLAFALFSLAFAGLPAAANAPTAGLQSPIGLWKTVDDKTGKPRALVRIYLKDGKYFGRIEHSFTPGAETRVCSVCTDERRNQPIIGLLIIRNVALRDGEYGGGDILDPDSGSVSPGAGEGARASPRLGDAVPGCWAAASTVCAASEGGPLPLYGGRPARYGVRPQV